MMNIDQLIELIDCGREIEFQCDGKKFSITYGVIDGEEVISFCEFYKESTEVKTAEELLEVQRYGKSVKDMISEITQNDIWIY